MNYFQVWKWSRVTSMMSRASRKPSREPMAHSWWPVIMIRWTKTMKYNRFDTTFLISSLKEHVSSIVPTGIHRFSRISTDFHGFPWIFMDFHGFPRVSTDSHGFPRVSTGCHGFPRVSTDFHGLPRVSTSFHEFPRVSTGFHEFPRVHTGFHGFPRVATGFYGFPRVSTCCHPVRAFWDVWDVFSKSMNVVDSHDGILAGPPNQPTHPPANWRHLDSSFVTLANASCQSLSGVLLQPI